MFDFSKLPPWMLVLVFLAGGGGTGVLTTTLGAKQIDDSVVAQIIKDARPDPFTGTQAKALEGGIQRQVAESERRTLQAMERMNATTVRLLMQDMCTRLRLLRAEMPPAATRDRIFALEVAMRGLSESFSQTGTSWGNLGPPCESEFGR